MNSLFNNIFLSISSYGIKLISTVLIYIVFANILIVSDYGLLIFGISFSGIMIVISEFGFSLMAQKDIPQKSFDLNIYVFNSLIQKIYFSIISFLIGFLYLYLIVDSSNFFVGLIFLLNAIVTAYVMYFISVFKAKNFFRIELKSSFIFFLFIIIILILNNFYNLNINNIATGFLLSRVSQLIIIFYDYYKKFSFN